jgi:hypothetical protein
MKKITLICLISFFGIQLLQAQEVNKIDASPLDFAVFRPDGQNAQPVARIIYSRPYKKERVIFGGIVPYGKIWRTGANQSAELNLFKDVSFEGQKLKAGSYTMYTIPGENHWTIIFNSKLYTWGAYDYDDSKDVIRFTVPVSPSKTERENFGIAFDGRDGSGILFLAWDKTEIYINFTY